MDIRQKEVEDWRQFIMDSGYVCMRKDIHLLLVLDLPEKLGRFPKCYINKRFEEKD